MLLACHWDATPLGAASNAFLKSIRKLSSFFFKLAGVALVVPFVNYKWRSLPADLTKEDYRKQLCRLMLLLTCYTPRLLHWWFTQKLFPSATVLEGNPTFFCEKDLDVLKNTPGYQLFTQVTRRQVVPVQLQRYVSELPWIRYHEVSDGGHLLVYDTAVCEAVLKSLLLGEDPPLYRPKLAD
ncbi:hypothetical protein HAX54_005211 [Datura stramonium]|uniref:Uncharacterized protein n=1 Tax=Datura stramonium TaxID=4076 RepID=A0ABS8T8C3_DATST|nr:hypothetical protein [Datura stramonium]